MNLRDVAAQILVNSKVSPSVSDAKVLLERELKKTHNYEQIQQWDQEVPEAVAQVLINRIGSNPDLNIEYLLKDLQAILKRSI